MKRQFVRKLWGEIFEMTSNALPFSVEKAILLIYPGRFILIGIYYREREREIRRTMVYTISTHMIPYTY